MRYVYADNSATTALSPKVLEKMMPYLTEVYGNPSSIYTIGAKARAAVETARENIAKNLGAANPNEIYFTSGGSESDNWALKGVCHALKAKGKKHIITSKFEHHAILHTCEALEKEGFEVTYLDVYENGIVHPEDVENAIREDTAIVSIMYANNEIGTIQPISEIGAICRKHGVLFHTDAVQAAGYVKIDVQKENIDLLSMTAHKLHGPKGCGLLYIRKGVRIENLICGGAQERNKRAGTENVAGIVGLDAALQLAVDGMDERNAKLEKMRDRLIDGLLKIERSRINGDRVHRLPGNVNMCFEGIEGESLLLRLTSRVFRHHRVLLVHRAVLIRVMYFLQSVFPTKLLTAVCVFHSLTTIQRKILIIFLKSFPKLFRTSEVCHLFGKRLKSRKLRVD